MVYVDDMVMRVPSGRACANPSGCPGPPTLSLPAFPRDVARNPGDVAGRCPPEAAHVGEGVCSPSTLQRDRKYHRGSMRPDR